MLLPSPLRFVSLDSDLDGSRTVNSSFAFAGASEDMVAE